jgi:dihydropteroate synthase
VQIAALLEHSRREQRPLLMGVVNVTPNSFFDGGRYLDPEAAKARVDRLLEDGADLLDIGAESTKPGAPVVSADEQLERLDPVLERALATGVPVSVDTTSAAVAEAVLSRGVTMINDVSCLAEPALARAVAGHSAWLALTHVRGPMSAMSGFSQWPDRDYPDIVSEVAREWDAARQTAVSLGVERERVMFDPGLGFAKNARHSFALLRHLRSFKALGAPVLIGPSRKSFIGAIDGSPAEQRLGGTIAASLCATLVGADVLRVHDVFEMRQALGVLRAIRDERTLPEPTPGAQPVPPPAEPQLPEPRECG